MEKPPREKTEKTLETELNPNFYLNFVIILFTKFFTKYEQLYEAELKKESDELERLKQLHEVQPKEESDELERLKQLYEAQLKEKSDELERLTLEKTEELRGSIKASVEKLEEELLGLFKYLGIDYDNDHLRIDYDNDQFIERFVKFMQELIHFEPSEEKDLIERIRERIKKPEENTLESEYIERLMRMFILKEHLKLLLGSADLVSRQIVTDYFNYCNELCVLQKMFQKSL